MATPQLRTLDDADELRILIDPPWSRDDIFSRKMRNYENDEV
jgi:hypothetical protein